MRASRFQSTSLGSASGAQVRLMRSASKAPCSRICSPQLNVEADLQDLEDLQRSVSSSLEEPPRDGQCGSSFACGQLDRDVHAIAEDDGKIANMHADAEKFDPRAEGD